eukprot:3710331-Rhodomonas_salina.2
MCIRDRGSRIPWTVAHAFHELALTRSMDSRSFHELPPTHSMDWRSRIPWTAQGPWRRASTSWRPLTRTRCRTAIAYAAVSRAVLP